MAMVVMMVVVMMVMMVMVLVIYVVERGALCVPLVWEGAYSYVSVIAQAPSQTNQHSYGRKHDRINRSKTIFAAMTHRP